MRRCPALRWGVRPAARPAIGPSSAPGRLRRQPGGPATAAPRPPARTAMNLDAIILLYRTAGASRHPEMPISHEQHALQCGALAQAAGSPPALVAAALLHGLGHLLPDLEGGDEDLAHELRVLPVLEPLFPPAVREPIRLQAQALRFLAVTEPHLLGILPPAALQALRRSGGPFAALEAVRFARQAHALDAIDLRRWAAHARSPTRITPGWGQFRPVLRAASGLPVQALGS